MKYLRILMACAGEVWLLEPRKLEAVRDFLLAKAAGEAAQEPFHAPEPRALAPADRNGGQAGRVAVVPVYGVLAQRMNMMDDISGGTSTQQIAAHFRAAMADDSVKSVVLDIDSPGGVSYGIAELADEIHAARGVKPVIAQVNSLAASAAYWLASQAEEIVVTPGGRAGSIGVYVMHEDISGALAKRGIKPTIIQAGENKTLGNMVEPLSDKARAELQGRVDEINEQFVAGVARGRNVSAKQVNETMGQGSTFGPSQLRRRGMADRTGTLEETLERLGVEARPWLRQKKGTTALAQLFDGGAVPTEREFEHGLRGELPGLPRSLLTKMAGAVKDWRGDPGRPAGDKSGGGSTLTDEGRAHLRQLLASVTTRKKD